MTNKEWQLVRGTGKGDEKYKGKARQKERKQERNLQKHKRVRKLKTYMKDSKLTSLCFYSVSSVTACPKLLNMN